MACSWAIAPVCAQDISQIAKSDPLIITGSIGTNNTYFHSSAGLGYMSPLSNSFFANLNFNIYGFSMPFSIYFSNDNLNFSYPQFSFNLSPSYKNFTAHIGQSSMPFSQYVLNMSFNGVGLEWRDKQFRASAFYGVLRRAVNDNPDDPTARIPQYRRYGWGISAGYSKGGNSIDLYFLRAYDSESSIDERWRTRVRPQENLVLGLKGQLSYKNFLSLAANVATSAFTADRESQQVMTDEARRFDKIDYAQSGGDLYLSANMSMGSITVLEATGKFDPEISLRDLGRTTIGSVPDFLTDGEVSVNLYNPLIDINIQSDIDVAGFVSGTLYAEDANGQEMARVRIPEFYIRPDGSTHVCICKYAEGVDASAYDQVVAVPQLSDIMRRIPKTVRFAAEARADASREGTMELGKSYTIQPAYSIMAPLAFDEGARIVYNDTIDGWTDDLEDIDLMAGSAIELTANVENKIPAYLTVSATAIDVQGKPIPENRIKVEVSSVINASEDGKTPVVTPLKIRLTEGEPGSVALVDGLTFRIEAASGEEGAKSIVGQTINAYNHTLKARDIKVRLVGKIIVNKD